MDKDLPKDKKLVSIGEAAEILGVSIDTVRRWDKDGILHSERKDGKNRYFSVEELERVKFSQPLPISEASKRLGISPSTLRRLEKKGVIKPHRNDAGERVYDSASLENFLHGEYYLRKRQIEEKVLEPLLEPKKKTEEKTEEKVPETGTHKILAAAQEETRQEVVHLENFKKLIYGTGLFLSSSFILLIICISVAFIFSPENTARFFGYRIRSAISGLENNQVLGDKYEPVTKPSVGIIGSALKPVSQISLGLVKQINPQVYNQIAPERPIDDVNDILAITSEGQISALYNLTIPDSSYLQIPDTGLIANLNAELLQGKTWGEDAGNLAVLGEGGTIGGLTDKTGISEIKSESSRLTIATTDNVSKLTLDVAGLTLDISKDSVKTEHIKDGEVKEGDIAGSAVSEDKLAGTLAFDDGDFLNLSAIVHDDTAVQGLRLPNASSASPSKPSSGEGYLAYDTSGDSVIFYNGSSWGIVDNGDITSATASDGLSGGGTSGAVTLSLNQGFAPTWTGAHTFEGNLTVSDSAADTITIGNSLDTLSIASTAFTVSSTGVISGAAGISSSGTITFSGLTASRALFTDSSSNLAVSGASSALLNALSDETGTGVAVFGTSPDITTSLTTGSTTFALVNANATTVNFAQAATTLTMGATTGTATIRNATLDLPNGSATVSGNLTLYGAARSIQTTALNTLTLGGATTGNIVIDSGSSAITLSDTVSPTTNDGAALGTTALMWSDLFLASGSVINLNNGDVTLTHASNALTFAGGNVGLGGQATPLTELDVTGSASLSANLSLRGSGTAHTFNILDNGTLNIRRSPGGDAGVTTALIYLMSNGNVGIGNTAPGTTLDVTGTLRASSTITFTGLTASRALFTDASSNLAATGVSANLLDALTDETGTGVAVFGTSPDITTSLTTGSTTFALVNANATTVNFAQAATTLTMGATTGTATIRNATLDLPNGSATVSGNLTLYGGARTIQTTAQNTLTIGGNTTGNIILSGASNVNNAVRMTDGTNTYLTLDTRTTTSGTSALTLAAGTAPIIDSAATAEYTTLTVTPPTIILTGTTNVTTQMDSVFFNRPALTDGSALTVTDATNVTIDGAPSVSGGISLTNSYALKINTRGLAGTTNGFGLYVDAPTGATNNYAAVFATGNVGIGNTTPLTALDITGSASASANLSLRGAGTGHTFKILDNGTLNFQRSPSGDVDLSSVLYLGSNGNIGVNTASPLAVLDINSPAITVVEERTAFRLNQQSLTVSTGYTSQRYSLIPTQTLSVDSGQTLTNAAAFYVAGAPLKIGAGTLTNTYAIWVDGGAVSSATNGFGLYVDAPTGATNNYAAVFATGNVGIGNTTPLTALDITGSASASANLSLRGAGTGHTFKILDNGTLNFQRSPGGDAGVTSVMFLGNNGAIGMGTAAPLWKLHVSESQSATAAATIHNTAANATAGHTGLIVKMGAEGSATDVNDNDAFIKFLRGDGRRKGQIIGASTGVVYETGQADFAEYFRKENREDAIDYGEIVCLGETGGVKKCDGTYSKILGVVSDSAAFVGRGDYADDPSYVIVGMVGQVRVKVNTESGAINASDPITSSLASGIGKKAIKAGYILGRALEGFDCLTKCQGKILVAVQPAYFNGVNVQSPFDGVSLDGGDVSGLILASLTSNKKHIIASQNTSLSEILTDRLAAGLEVITPQVTTDVLSANVIKPSTNRGLVLNLTSDGKFIVKDEVGEEAISFDSFGNAFFRGTINADKLKANQIEGLEIITDKISSLASKVAGIATSSAGLSTSEESNAASEVIAQAGSSEVLLESVKVSLDMTVLGKLNANGGLVIMGPSEFREETIFEKMVTFISNVIFRGKVTFEEVPTFNKDTAGLAIITKDTDQVVIVFEKEYEQMPFVTVGITLDASDKNFADKTLEEQVKAQEILENDLLSYDLKYFVTKRDSKGFVIKLSKKAPVDVPFSWHAIAVKDSIVVRSKPPVVEPTSIPSPTVESTIEPSIIPSQETTSSAVTN